MPDLPISGAASLTRVTIATNDLIPVLDVSAPAGSKGSHIPVAELTGLTSLVRGSGDIYGHTTPGGDASTPTPLQIEFYSFSADGELHFNFNGTTYSFFFATTDPSVSFPSFWVDTSTAGNEENLRDLFLSAIYGAGVPDITAELGGSNNQAVISTGITGSGAVLQLQSSAGFSVNNSGGGYGVEGTSAIGAVSEVTIIPATAGKTTRAVRIGAFGEGVSAIVQVALKTAENAYARLGELPAPAAAGELAPDLANLADWLIGQGSTSIIARMVDESGNALSEESSPVGGSLTVWAIAEQV